jgi:hypothetical protein
MWSGGTPPFEGSVLHTSGRPLDFTPSFPVPILEECAERLVGLLAQVPGITGIRFKLPPLTGPGSFGRFSEMVRLCGNLRSALENAMPELDTPGFRKTP